MTKLNWIVGSFLISAALFAKVTGKPVEKLGVQWQASSFKHWVERADALITPEVANLAAQYCLRTTQESLDGVAYDKLAKRMVSELSKRFSPKTAKQDLEKALSAVSQILVAIEKLEVPDQNPASYLGACNVLLERELRDRAGTLLPIFEGRMHPVVSGDIGEPWKTKLETLRKRGVVPAPLTWKGLQEQVCKLEGYYSLSQDARLWKLFSMTRLMSNVLTSSENNPEFERTLAGGTRTLQLLVRKLDRYSSVAGRSNVLRLG